MNMKNESDALGEAYGEINKLAAEIGVLLVENERLRKENENLKVIIKNLEIKTLKERNYSPPERSG